ncbi:hypothetical protein UY286_13380 [Paenibacillus polymyxa]|uniref:Uncharacterized protein n=1 Tax=Paenibacillus polymyxa TaxID=1406 RepID=A0AAE9Q0U6_PAEPO|nr:hypothetical protein [Paenibacillus polymyxa]MDY7992209.1 hypothetical protein [Paenibacillus polymyxa]MDY8118425.1 hypothetical protein [Paenibacillus polymyxa]
MSSCFSDEEDSGQRFAQSLLNDKQIEVLDLVRLLLSPIPELGCGVLEAG